MSHTIGILSMQIDKYKSNFRTALYGCSSFKYVHFYFPSLLKTFSIHVNTLKNCLSYLGLLTEPSVISRSKLGRLRRLWRLFFRPCQGRTRSSPTLRILSSMIIPLPMVGRTRFLSLNWNQLVNPLNCFVSYHLNLFLVCSTLDL